MKRKSAVVFPDTVPAMQALIPLVLVFEPVVYCQPVENDDSGEPLDPFCTAMVEQSFCTLHAPAPLGANRDRFLHLVRDLRQRRDDYAAQLSNVSLASISTRSQPGSESKSSILSTLLSGHGIDSSGQEQMGNLLWQARLVLKLGEQYAADQHKVAEDIHNIHQRELNMFHGLNPQSGSPFSLTGKLSSLVSERDGMQRLRLKAWARLFALGSVPIAGARFFVSTDPDAVDRLGEEYERSNGSHPNVFLKIPLPVHLPDKNMFQDQCRQFLDHEVEILNKLFVLLENPSAVSEVHRRMFSGQKSDWSVLLDRYFPLPDCGRGQLVLYDFSRVKVKHLFLSSFAHDEDNLPAEMVEEIEQDFVIGLLTEQ